MFGSPISNNKENRNFDKRYTTYCILVLKEEKKKKLDYRELFRFAKTALKSYG